MRVLYLSQYFPPEVGATQTRAYEMATGLIRAGHQVTMLAEVPNHPEGIIRPEYRGRFWTRETLDGIDVIRVWVKTAPVKTMRTRLAFYLTYMLNATLAGLVLARGRYDVVYATSPPLFVGGAALALSLLRRIPLVFEVRDLWPESAVALGELENPRFIRWATWLEECCYRRAWRIVVVTEGIRARLIERGIPSEKLALIPNGANTDLFHPQPEAGQSLRRELGLGDCFLALYAGIHGIAQGLETVLEAACRLADVPRIHFLFVGNGPRKADLLRLKEDLSLSSVTMLDAQPREAIPTYLSAADVALVPLRRLELFKNAVPSKMFDAWACGCPVVLSIDGEARRVLERAQAGVFVEPESAEAMAETIRALSTDSDRCRAYGRNGRRFVEAHYSRQAQARRLVELLEALTT
ncbi:MAG TPA: glycosyltransferase WbuB [Anaerolineae bacterium]|nr:glycosyltransferase WbuB [Anaerolineae bacterium]